MVFWLNKIHYELSFVEKLILENLPSGEEVTFSGFNPLFEERSIAEIYNEGDESVLESTAFKREIFYDSPPTLDKYFGKRRYFLD